MDTGQSSVLVIAVDAAVVAADVDTDADAFFI
jgi:hypothetical protein